MMNSDIKKSKKATAGIQEMAIYASTVSKMCRGGKQDHVVYKGFVEHLLF